MNLQAQGGALEGRECREGEHGECAVFRKICPWQRGLWHGLPEEKAREKSSPQHALHGCTHGQRGPWGPGVPWRCR